jgi:hypothetical protein
MIYGDKYGVLKKWPTKIIGHSFHDQVFGEKKRKWLAGGDVWWEEVVQMSHFTGPFNTEVNSIDPY